MVKQYKLLPGHKIEVKLTNLFPFISISRVYRVLDQWSGKIYQHRESIRCPIATDCSLPTGVLDEETAKGI